MFFDQVPEAPQMTSEQLFLESLQTKLAQHGGTQQDCISQLRALNLGDNFWMYAFKVVPCAKTYSHKWTLCPCAHAGETARRRDPRSVNYKAVLCPLVKAKKTCPLGDACSYAHNVFEHWLHPSRYKTRLCSFGRNCNRPICFFAHSAEELRCVPNVDEGKELDEREYLLQLMLAQESGLLPSSAQLSGNQQTQAAAAALLQSGGAGAAGAAGLDVQVQQILAASKTPRGSMSGTHGSMSMSQQDMLMNLQEALAGVTLGVDGLSAVSGAPHHGAGRTSDPGLPTFGGSHLMANVHSHGAVHPLPHMNRISDSGQTLGLASPKGLAASLESLLPYVNSALQQQHAALVRSQSMQSSPPRSPAPVSSPGGSSTPGGSSENLTAHSSSTSVQPSSPAPPSAGNGAGGANSQQALANLASAAAAAAGSSAISPAYVNKIVSELQEQGLASSKEQLVASLSQLLAQLLSVGN